MSVEAPKRHRDARHHVAAPHGHRSTCQALLQTQPYKQDGNKLWGPDIADDKSGIALMLRAVKILNDVDWRDYDPPHRFDTPEEVGSFGSKVTTSALADQNDTVLSFEPTDAKAEGPGEPSGPGSGGSM